MHLETLYFVTQILAALAVVGSLIFVGLQVRVQAREVAQNRVEQRIAHSASLRQTILESPDLRLIIIKANDDGIAALSRDERLAFFSWCRRMLLLGQLIETGLDRKKGERPPRDSAANLARTFMMQGFREFWTLFANDFEPDFRAFIEELTTWGEREGLEPGVNWDKG